MVDNTVIVKAPRCRDDSLNNHKSLIGDKIVEWINGIGKMSRETWKGLGSVPGYVLLQILNDSDSANEVLKICRFVNAHPEVGENEVFEKFQIDDSVRKEQIRHLNKIILDEPAEDASITETEPQVHLSVDTTLKKISSPNNQLSEGTPILRRINGKSSRKTFHVNVGLLERAKKIAAERGISLSQFVNCSISELLNRLREEN